ncbi:PAS domain-containing protein [Planomonospora sp. ID91781]|uniref:YheO domain-containing protein n=3 Tax=Planomonospora TaxID=1998 RepID=A0A161MB18_9ACTN|nr:MULTISPECIES: PAS domain-containing protein [Planomonospora]MBG0823359.1 PAS domain-containing protein [Planomonospora sp. ID91781]GAT67053.1 yheO domain-containing protein [Planomonospora sphaerica]GGK77726.1 DNA-binding protein [Planomonospora parontospora]GII09951.1 DNA-binding protein [Planomonospora parontospora subsp. parontospora]
MPTPPAPETSAARDLADLEPILRPIMKAVAAAVGPHCEVVLHDLSGDGMEHTIAAIENGHVTGRAVGGPSTNLGLEMRRQEAEDHDEYGYRGRTADGRELRSSSVYLRDPDGRVIAALCVNVDMTPLQAARASLDEVLKSTGAAPDRDEIFAGDINEVLDNLIETAIANTGKAVALMDREHKIEVLRFLDRKGAFFVKRAVDRVARRLGVSRVTAYNYLDQIRAGTG